MSRLVKDRGSVGRRVWRRRKKKRTSLDTEPTDALIPLPTELTPPLGKPQAPARSLWQRLSSWLNEPKRKSTEPAYLQTDPVGDVLALARGPQRLDGFVAALKDVEKGTSAEHDLALAFFRELTALSDNAGVDLSLYRERVEVCARALEAVGYVEKAGNLLLRIGQRENASALFVSAGAVEKVDDTLARIAFDEGGAKLDAKLAFERAQALMQVGRRAEAYAAQKRAVSLFAAPAYRDALHHTEAQLGRPHVMDFVSPTSSVCLISAWPVSLGRDSNAHIQLNNPALSREHAKFKMTPTGCVVVPVGANSLFVGGVPATTVTTLAVDDQIRCAGMQLTVLATAAHLRLQLSGPSPRDFVGLRSGDFSLDTNITLRAKSDGRFFAVAGTMHNGVLLTEDQLLFDGDQLGHWRVQARHV